MSLNLRRTFDNARCARMTKRSREEMIFAESRRPGDFQTKIDHCMKKLRGEEFDISRLGAHIQLLVRFPGAEVSERLERFVFAEKVTDGRSPSIAGFLVVRTRSRTTRSTRADFPWARMPTWNRLAPSHAWFKAQPLPTSPRTWDLCTRQFSNTSSQGSLPAIVAMLRAT